MPPTTTTTSSSSSNQQQQQPTTCTKRLLSELKAHLSHSSPSSSQFPPSHPSNQPSPAIVSLGPVTEDNILHWTSILRGPQDTPYSAGLWALDIHIPPTYPHAPPHIKFLTPICHPNVSFPTGEICLDLLKHGPSAGADGGGGTTPAATTDKQGGNWSPAYTISKCLEAIQMLIAYPEVDSPLNVDVARLLKGGDRVGGESLVRFWCEEFRWRG